MAIETRSTTDVLFERYNTLTRREAGLNANSRKIMFRAFARTLGPWLPPAKDSHILDLGCGEGTLLAFLRDRGYTDLSGFDLSPENTKICHQKGLTFVSQHNALSLSDYPGRKVYSAIFCLDLLEHLPKERALGFLCQVYSKLDKCGYVVFQVPNMGSVLGIFHRYNDLSHEYGMTENSVVTLLMSAGFKQERIEVRPSWNATTWLGHLRELYLRGLHAAVWMAEGKTRPRIPTKNLLIRAFR